MIEYIIALFTILIFLFFFIRKPNVETYIKYTLWTLPFTDTKILPLAYGFIKVFDVLAIIAFIFLFKHFITVHNQKVRMTYFVLIILFIGLTLISKYFSEFPTEKSWSLYPIFTVFIFTRFLVLYLNKDFNRRYLLFNILKRSFLFCIIFMLIQLIVGLKFTYYAQLHDNVIGDTFITTRFPGIFLDSQTNGTFLTMASFFFLIMKPNPTKRKKKLGYIAFAITTCFIILAGSRAPLGGFILSLFLIFIFSSNKIKLIMLSAGFLLAISMFIVKPDTAIFKRTEHLGDDYSFRESIWTETITIIENIPLFGIGIGNFEKFLMKYKQDLNIVLEPGVSYYYFNQPENGYLKIIVEHGILASLILFGIILWTITKNIVQLIQQKASKEALFIICSAFSFLVAFNTLYSFFDYRLSCLFSTIITLAIVYSNSKIPKMQNNINLKSVTNENI